MPELSLTTEDSILAIPQTTWDHFSGGRHPFLRHSFLAALERTGCTTADTGWQPCHLKLSLNGELVGVAPAYLKGHSMGEYVFDWAWADAYRHHGLRYYPKLLVAVPFTPCQGPRLLLEPGARDRLRPGQINQALDQLMTGLGLSSWHLLFPEGADQRLLSAPNEAPDADHGAGQLHRLGCQFHWHNRGYSGFDDFLARLTSRKRKSIRRERRQVLEQGISFEHFNGDRMPADALETFYGYYQATYFKRGQRPYLNLDFFRELQRQQPESLHLVMARRHGQWIAAALFLIGDDTLYGRYWGCLEEYQHLHFETCYYQGIELAIERGLKLFDAGAQGEHKLIRGFEPTLTHSWHGIAHPGFRDAIARFVEDEAGQVRQYRQDAGTALPFRQDSAAD